MLKLEEICNIVTGQIMSRVEAKEKDTVALKTLLITPKAIEDGIIHPDELTEVSLKKMPDDSKFVHTGDIVVKLSTPYSAALISDVADGAMVSSFCAIIRDIDAGYDARFLTSYLNTRYVREHLRRTTVGSVVPLLRVNDLKALLIPKVDPQKSKKAVQALEINQKKKEVLKDLLETCNAYDESIVLSAIGDVE